MAKKKIFNDIKELPEFKKDLKKLFKNKFQTLKDDLEIFTDKQLKLYHKFNIDNKGIFPISGLAIEYPKIYKARKFARKSLKGKGAASGIRIIYAYYEDKDIIELIEIYYKGEKQSEDKERIKRNYNRK